MVDDRWFISIFIPAAKSELIGIDFTLDNLSKIAAKLDFGSRGYLTMVSHGGLCAAQPKSERLGLDYLSKDPWAKPYVRHIKTRKHFETRNISGTLGGPAIRISVPITIG